MPDNDTSEFNFEISLSVLDHLGRNLYRNFITVLGEAISNSWDADADNVWISIDQNDNNFVIKDDGIGMSTADFQTKFLKIGYTKRKGGVSRSKKGRPFIGRKGIGKLALLSCAEKISIQTKTDNTGYIGGVINNSALDRAIDKDVTPQEYVLEATDDKVFTEHKKEHLQGTIIYFENINDGIKNKLGYIKILIGLHFKFSLLDKSFNIFVNGEKITEKQLNSLAEQSQFLWQLNTFTDPYISTLKNLKNQKLVEPSLSVKGFIASVEKPSHLKIRTTDEKVGIDLFVNGRLRERDILSHFPEFSTRVVASYLYGQIHFDILDNGLDDDRFSTSRESVKEGDVMYKKLLGELKNILNNISAQWDEWRIIIRQDGDIDNPRITPKERKAKSLVNEVRDEFTPSKSDPNKNKINKWLDDLSDEAQFNVSAYTDCFMSENLIRKYIKHKARSLSAGARKVVTKWKNASNRAKIKANLTINIVNNDDDLSYLAMDNLASLLDEQNTNNASLSKDATEYKPMRNAVAHTARLTQPAKDKLTSVYENIKAGIKNLFSQ